MGHLPDLCHGTRTLCTHQFDVGLHTWVEVVEEEGFEPFVFFNARPNIPHVGPCKALNNYPLCMSVVSQ